MGIEWIVYKGKRILSCNFGGMVNDAESLKLLKQEMKYIAQSPEPVLLLVNLAGSIMSPENSQYTKEQLQLLGTKVKKSALTGVTGFKPVIVEGIGRASNVNQAIFVTEEEAKEWLVS